MFAARAAVRGVKRAGAEPRQARPCRLAEFEMALVAKTRTRAGYGQLRTVASARSSPKYGPYLCVSFVVNYNLNGHNIFCENRWLFTDDIAF